MDNSQKKKLNPYFSKWCYGCLDARTENTLESVRRWTTFKMDLLNL